MDSITRIKSGQMVRWIYLAMPRNFDLDSLLGNFNFIPYQSNGKTIQLDSFLLYDDGYVNLNINEATHPTRFPVLLHCGPKLPENYQEVHIIVSGTSKKAEWLESEAVKLLSGAKKMDISKDDEVRDKLFKMKWERSVAERRLVQEYQNMVNQLSDGQGLGDIRLSIGPLTQVLGQYIEVGYFPIPQPPSLYVIRDIHRKEGLHNNKKVRVSLFHLAGPLHSGIYGAIALMPFEEGCPTYEAEVCNQAKSFSGFYAMPDCLIFGGTNHSNGRIVSPGACLTFHGNANGSDRWPTIEKYVRTGLVDKPLATRLVAQNLSDLATLTVEASGNVKVSPGHMNDIVSVAKLAHNAYVPN
jgi:hypothetical protein